jgi:predicted nucleotidyltransferase
LITTAQNILKTLGYFDLFLYPLTKEEIYLFHSGNELNKFVYEALDVLIAEGAVFKIEEFYSLQNDPALIQRRRKGNQLAAEQMTIANKAAKILAKFPYIKSVAVSGSLSKNFATETSDIDFFIITAPNRLWVARTMMHLYKKLTFLIGRQDWFCMNYYVDEAELEIPEQNIFTAMEIITLIPLQGNGSLHNFFIKNNWTKKFFPLHAYKDGNTVSEIKRGKFKKIIEQILGGRTGDKLDKWLMNITDKRWQKKTQTHQLNSKGADMAMSVGRHFSKPDPKNFQQKVLEQYRIKVQQLLLQQNKTAAPVQ